jgi:hypothetical protein
MAGKIFFCSIAPVADPVADPAAIIPNRSPRKAFSKGAKARIGSKSTHFGYFLGKCAMG